MDNIKMNREDKTYHRGDPGRAFSQKRDGIDREWKVFDKVEINGKKQWNCCDMEVGRSGRFMRCIVPCPEISNEVGVFEV